MFLFQYTGELSVKNPPLSDIVHRVLLITVLKLVVIGLPGFRCEYYEADRD